jgi:hypothetical protein
MMADSNELEWFNERVEVAHEFEVDLNCLVATNHRLTLDAITRAEDEEMGNWQKALAQQDREVASSVLHRERGVFDDLRKAANHLALVGIVTRLQHWVGRLVDDRGPKTKKKKRRNRDSILISQLRILNETLGDGPVQLTDFEKLVDVRDSIIHGDAQTEWTDGRVKRKRKVAEEYCNGCRVEVSENQVKEAVEKAIRQVEWYDQKLQPPP